MHISRQLESLTLPLRPIASISMPLRNVYLRPIDSRPEDNQSQGKRHNCQVTNNSFASRLRLYLSTSYAEMFLAENIFIYRDDIKPSGYKKVEYLVIMKEFYSSLLLL